MSDSSAIHIKRGSLAALVIAQPLWPAEGVSMEAYQDGVNADRHGSDYKRVKSQVNSTTRLKN